MSIVRSLKVFLFLVSFWGSRSFAFDILPEYQGISETELSRMETPRDQDAEYQSQMNSYSTSLDWDQKFYFGSRVLDTTVGSVTNQHFMIYNRAKFEKDLSDSIHFRFTYFAQRDREVDQSRHILELSQKISPWLKVSAYGEPSLYKRENDIGAALLISPTEKWENRVYYTMHDFTRSGHNDQADSFVGEDPGSYGWTSYLNNEAHYLRAGFRYDKPTGWNLPQQGKFFRYEKTLFFADSVWKLENAQSVGFRAQVDSTFKGQNPIGTATTAVESWKTQRQLFRAFYGTATEEDWASFEYSLMYASRIWTNQAGSKVAHQSWLPSFLTRLRTVSREEGFDHVQLALEVTDFKTYGDLSLTPVNQSHESVQTRLQTAYEFNLRATKFLLALNFDLDENTSSSFLPTFEGGNGQFRTEF